MNSAALIWYVEHDDVLVKMILICYEFCSIDMKALYNVF